MRLRLGLPVQPGLQLAWPARLALLEPARLELARLELVWLELARLELARLELWERLEAARCMQALATAASSEALRAPSTRREGKAIKTSVHGWPSSLPMQSLTS